jgi:hypothetical protein
MEAPLKCQSVSIILHCAISHKRVIFILTAVRNWNLSNDMELLEPAMGTNTYAIMTLSTSTQIMETVSETLHRNSILTWLIAHEDFVVFSCHKILKILYNQALFLVEL